MIKKLDEIISLTSRIYDLYIDLIDCEISDKKDEIKVINEHLKLCLDAEQSFYNKLFLNKENFINFLRLLNVDNNVLLSFPYYYGDNYVITKSPILFEMEYMYIFLFYNDDKKISKNIDYHEMIKKTHAHPILRRIVFNLYQTFYHSKNYEPFVFNNYLQYLNLDYINSGNSLKIAKQNYNFLEELLLESSSEFTVKMLNSMKDKMNNEDNYLYVYMKYILAFINKNTEKKLLSDDCLGKNKKIKLPSVKYNTGTTNIYKYYLSRIGKENLNIMSEFILNDEIYNDEVIEQFSLKLLESLINVCFEIYDKERKKEFLEELKNLKETLNNQEYKKLIDKICKNKQYIYK